MNRDLIDQYRDAGLKLSEAVRGLTRQDVTTAPDPADHVGAWTIQQVVIHILDSDLVMLDRMKRVIAEENPTLLAFDETRWAQQLHYGLQPVDEAVAVYDLYHHLFAGVLEALPEAAWQRIGTHSQRGPLRLEQILEGAVNHLTHHLKFIHAKREKFGKSIW